MTISVFLRGGLGNQLFQYAAGLFLSSKQGESVVYRGDLLPSFRDSIGKVSRWPAQLGEFKMRGQLVTRTHQPFQRTDSLSKLLQVQRFLGDIMPSTLERVGVLAAENLPATNFGRLRRIHTINSYCTSREVAESLGEELKSDIRSVVKPSRRFLELIAESEAYKPVSIHMRLGDYRDLHSIYGRISPGSLERALSFGFKSGGRPIWLFTDSPESVDPELTKRLNVKKVIGPDQLMRPLENLILMSQSSALFCSNSSFSWWAAFLIREGGEVHYPTFDSVVVDNFGQKMAFDHWKPYAA
jgi:hypothetical protein